MKNKREKKLEKRIGKIDAKIDAIEMNEIYLNDDAEIEKSERLRYRLYDILKETKKKLEKIRKKNQNKGAENV